MCDGNMSHNQRHTVDWSMAITTAPQTHTHTCIRAHHMPQITCRDATGGGPRRKNRMYAWLVMT